MARGGRGAGRGTHSQLRRASTDCLAASRQVPHTARQRVPCRCAACASRLACRASAAVQSPTPTPTPHCRPVPHWPAGVCSSEVGCSPTQRHALQLLPRCRVLQVGGRGRRAGRRLLRAGRRGATMAHCWQRPRVVASLLQRCKGTRRVRPGSLCSAGRQAVQGSRRCTLPALRCSAAPGACRCQQRAGSRRWCCTANSWPRPG